ncbi:MAG: hypothetical protein EOP08_00305 [Proteobacteria bacterium]|nr:MAG: hypothetical protein EOP08_00305 [Pseudomonadota bacterium]
MTEDPFATLFLAARFLVALFFAALFLAEGFLLDVDVACFAPPRTRQDSSRSAFARATLTRSMRTSTIGCSS